MTEQVVSVGHQKVCFSLRSDDGFSLKNKKSDLGCRNWEMDVLSPETDSGWMKERFHIKADVGEKRKTVRDQKKSSVHI